MGRPAVTIGILLSLALSHEATSAPAPAFAPPLPLRFTRLGIDDGLSNSYVWTILQDHQGFMWFGTDGGLNRYDGYEFKVYRHDGNDPRSLVHNFIWVLFEDGAGTLWAGSNGGGLARYDRENDNFVHYRHAPGDPRSLPHDNVKSILEDRDGVLWVGTEGGLCRLDRHAGTCSTYKHDPVDPHSLGGDRVDSIVEDRETDSLWLGLMGGGLNRLDRRTGVFTRYPHAPGDPGAVGDMIRSVTQDKAGRVWASTREGLYRLDPGAERFHRIRHDPADSGSLADDNVTSTHEDRSGRFWVTTFGGLSLMDRDTGRCLHYRHDPGDPDTPSDDQIRTIYEDSTGALWLGTVTGISRLANDPTSFVTYRHNPGTANSLSHGLVQALHVDRRGHTWIGTAAGLNRFDGRSFFRYTADPRDPYARRTGNIKAIAEDREGAVWAGTSGGGLCRVDGGTFRCHRHDSADPRSLGVDYIDTLVAGRDGGLWLGLPGFGLDHFDGRAFTHFEPQPDDPTRLPSRYVLSIVEDRSGALWLGTNNSGLVRLEPDRRTFTTYRLDPAHPTSEAANRVHALYDPGGDTLWVGAESGLLRFDRATRRFTQRFTRSDGMPADGVVSILGDDSGGLWLGTSAGLSRFDPAHGRFRNYGRSDGLPSSQFTWRACAKTADGRLLFGGVGGFSVFDPRRLVDNPHLPPVVLTGFELFNKPVAIGAPGSPLTKAIHVADEITLAHGQSVFRVQFAALDYASPRNNQYSWKMEGFDAEWTQAAADRRHATYTNLDPGHYVFRVRGSNNHGRWNEADRALRITITPPWWSAWWLKVLAGAAGFGLLLAAHRFRVRTIGERERRFRTLAESAPDVVARFDHDLRCRYVNPAVETLTGLPAATFIGRTPAELGLLDAGVPRWEEPLRRAIETGEPVMQEITLGSADGARWFEVRLVPERGSDGRTHSVVAITRDITARKQSEDQMRASLEEKVVLLKEIHHRVKNNLQVICSLLNLQANTAEPDAREILQQSQSRVRIMALIHEKLYESPDLARVDAVEYLRTLVTAALYAYDVREDRIRARVEGDAIAMDADTAIPLGLLINELVTNALKHAFPAGRTGTITVALWSAAAGQLHLRVADDGVGLPAGVTQGRSGTLGLQLVDALVGQLGGTLETSAEEGARFDVRFAAVKYRPRF